jgi:ATP-dependent DNA helicase RecQ
MREFMRTETCLMSFAAAELDDTFTTGSCGRCSACLGIPLVPPFPTLESLTAAEDFLNSNPIVIEPRKQLPNGLSLLSGARGRIRREAQAEPGIAVAYYGSGTVGRLLKVRWLDGLRFGPEILDAAVRALGARADDLGWVVSVPSQSRPFLRNFAQELATRCGIEWFDAITKIRQTEPQKSMENSAHQLRNIDGAFEVTVFPGMRERPGLLVDDIVDSRWTFALLTMLLRSNGSGPVVPFALATAGRDDG